MILSVTLKEILPVLLPVILLQLGLAAFALVHVLRHRRFRFGNLTFWIIIVAAVSIIGPIVYFAFGRENY